MEKQFSNYLGQWIINDNKDPERCTTITCLRVDEATRTAIFDDGRKVSLFDLDNSNGVYEKLHSIYDAPEVKKQLQQISGSLSSQAYPSPKLGDLSKIGHNNPQNSDLRLNEEELENKFNNDNNDNNDNVNDINENKKDEVDIKDPVATFISSAIKLSRRKGNKSVIPVKISLELDFDIISVISSAASLGATDVEILQHIFNEISISPSVVKKAIFNELLKSPDDVDIAMSERENEFNSILKEELSKHDNDNPIYKDI